MLLVLRYRNEVGVSGSSNLNPDQWFRIRMGSHVRNSIHKMRGRRANSNGYGQET